LGLATQAGLAGGAPTTSTATIGWRGWRWRV
jgi:hypothetical protein